jgi:hypothetical protein
MNIYIMAMTFKRKLNIYTTLHWAIAGSGSEAEGYTRQALSPIDEIVSIGTLTLNELFSTQNQVLAGDVTVLTPVEVEALVNWSRETERENGCSGWGPVFDAAMKVAHIVRKKANR